MLSEHDIEQAHPDAFDFAFGNLPPARRAGFDRHLAGCRYCQAIIDEYAEIGGIIKNLPPHVEPPEELEERTVTAMVAVLAEQRASADRQSGAEQAATRVYPVPQVHHGAEPETLVRPRPQLGSPAEDDTRLRPSPGPPTSAGPQARPMVTRLPVWRRYRGRLAAVAVAAAAAIIVAAIVVPLSLGRGPAELTVVIPLHATGKVSGFAAATGQAVARQDASGSWDITLTVDHLKNFGNAPWYGCWYVSRNGGAASLAHSTLGTAGAGRSP